MPSISKRFVIVIFSIVSLLASGHDSKGVADPVDLQLSCLTLYADDIEACRHVPGVMALHVNPGAMNEPALLACRDRFGSTPVVSFPAISYLNKDQAVVRAA